jgi:deoxyribose-phosphate aldolase
VIPYSAYLQGKKNDITPFITACKKACKSKILKVILETGIINNFDLIFTLSCEVINAGADFIKTSTGKVPVNATLEAAVAMLNAIKVSNTNAGFKAAGGIRTQQQAAGYLFLAEQIMGKDWVTSQNFRLGASILLDNLLKF